jgi:hypothetical protein
MSYYRLPGEKLYFFSTFLEAIEIYKGELFDQLSKNVDFSRHMLLKY